MTKQSGKPDTPGRGRSSARRKTDAVLRRLRGEDLETPSRQLGVTAATPSSSPEGSLEGGTAALTSRPTDDRDEVFARLRAEVGQRTMDNELLGQEGQHLESGRPLASRGRGT